MHTPHIEPAELQRRRREHAARIRRNARLLYRLGFTACPDAHELLDEVGARIFVARKGVLSHFWIKDLPFTRVNVEYPNSTLVPSCPSDDPKNLFNSLPLDLVFRSKPSLPSKPTNPGNTSMLKNDIPPSLFDVVFNSAPNAKQKGIAQYFTPTKWARLLSIPLPRYRRTVIDLNCGAGALLRGAANDTTEHRLGCDIDGSQLSSSQLPADLTLLAPFLHDVKFEADLFVLNPPWDLHWHRSRLPFLDNARSASVRAAFAAHDGRTSRDTIDSSIATLCLALEFCSDRGEGFILMNQSTAKRLILHADAPHRDLRDHVWAVQHLPADTAAPVASTVLYFAADHLTGPQLTREDAGDGSRLITFAERTHREGAEVGPYQFTAGSDGLWQAAAEEYTALHASRPKPRFNLWLEHGIIRANVSLYDSLTGRVPKEEAALLHSLAGRRPMQLVVQRTQRDALKRACGLSTSPSPGGEGWGEGGPLSPVAASPWQVDPALRDAVSTAFAEYNAARAPLYPLPPIQRLGYLDEEDWIECKADLVGTRSTASPINQSTNGTEWNQSLPPIFLAGRRYPITTQTVAVRRPARKINLDGSAEDLELTGQELAIFITGSDGRRYCFMEPRLLSQTVTIERPGEDRPTDRKGNPAKVENLPKDRFVPAAEVIDFTLPQLVDAFTVPDVPDVATVNPDGYRKNLELLDQIESLCQ